MTGKDRRKEHGLRGPSRARGAVGGYAQAPTGKLAHPCDICRVGVGQNCVEWAWDTDGKPYIRDTRTTPHRRRGEPYDWDNPPTTT